MPYCEIPGGRIARSTDIIIPGVGLEPEKGSKTLSLKSQRATRWFTLTITNFEVVFWLAAKIWESTLLTALFTIIASGIMISQLAKLESVADILLSLRILASAFSIYHSHRLRKRLRREWIVIDEEVSALFLRLLLTAGGLACIVIAVHFIHPNLHARFLMTIIGTLMCLLA